jgi:cellulose synthase/poly-beta-1,6-N-acetylglucosamine synthase-like glycosyltransferase
MRWYLGVDLSSRFNKKTLIRWKVHIDRSKMYIGYVQFLLIIFVFIKSLGENPVTEFVFTSPLIAVPIILVIFVLFSLVIGYLDSRLGFREEEIRNHSKSNPVLMDIQKSLTELNDKISRMEQDNKITNVNAKDTISQ